MAAEEPLDAAARVAAASAHEFNNHVTAIALQAELALASPAAGDEKLRRRLQGILGSCEAARTLSRGLLAFGGRRALEPERVDVRRAVARIAGGVVTAEPDVPLVVEVDADVFEEALAELSAAAGDGPLSLSAGGDLVELRFAGRGIEDDEESFRRLFEPFAREAKALGLAAVYGFVRQSGGRVALEHGPGGTEIVLRLPRAATASPPRLTRLPGQHPPRGTGAP